MEKVKKFGDYISSVFDESITKQEKRKRGWVGHWNFEQYNGKGELIWSHDALNNLADEGEISVLETYLRGSAAPGTFYIRLYGVTPVDTSTLATLTGEPAGSGYAAATVFRTTGTNGWPNMALAAGDYTASSGTFSFTCTSGSWGPVTYATLTTVGTGTLGGLLVAYVALSGSRILQNSDTLNVAMQVKLQ